jgi:hypothetical protein
MTGCHFVKKREDSRDASFVRVEFCHFIYMKFLTTSFLQYTLYVDRHARHRRKTPEFEERVFFGQLNQILLLELSQMPQLALAEPATLILAVIHQVKATLRDDLYYYKDFGTDEVVNLNTVQCVVGRVKDRGEWTIVDRSNITSAQVD